MSSAHQLPLGDPAEFCQRWRYRRHSWLRRREGGFDQSSYQARMLDHDVARRFVAEHHYSRSWPAVRLAVGLYATDPRAGREGLVGVLALGVPMHPAVLTGPFPNLVPYRESLELSRLVLLDQVPANGESWFVAHAFRLAAQRGIRGIVAHSDPQPRVRQTPNGPEDLHPGHVGTTYQASSMDYLGRTRRRRLTVLPDATVLPDRAQSKIRADEAGHLGAERRLVAFGARPRRTDEDGARWLAEALEQVGATVLDHHGNHRYARYIGPTRRHGRSHSIAVTAYPFPKKNEPGGSR
ncbi:hypothetical protein OG533_39440 (plasmid) [Streptomyces sp. NBC_01186]|uniref:Mom family adenine methylcarbamoylation protein n=1 Tax=unclassified Streptomyces TaxID=2593676 RepID=UPI002DDA7449|nr:MULTISPECIES: hypothetical protein [unclassified Streptomyces]WSB81985.1 hypothetical protein OHB04_40330 [Streptomyces sp. NBC_01775]WSS17960.1 hypothetical protein OG533_39440 [Streptomyces sp. NBC_01186]